MYLKIPKAKIARIQIVKTNRKLSLQQVVAKYKCDAAINGGLYDMHTGEINPIPLRINGQTIATSPDGYWCLAWDVGPDIKMIHSRDIQISIISPPKAASVAVLALAVTRTTCICSFPTMEAVPSLLLRCGLRCSQMAV